MDARSFGKMMKKWGKAYKKPVFVWAKLLDETLDGYTHEGQKAWELFRALVKGGANYRQVVLAVALLGELVDDTQHRAQGLEPYGEADLYALVAKIADRMEQYREAPFWEVAGYTPEQAQRTFSLIRTRWALHPLNVARAYGEIMKDVETWQDALVRTFYFAQVRSQLEQELKSGVKGKITATAQNAGVLKV